MNTSEFATLWRQSREAIARACDSTQFAIEDLRAAVRSTNAVESLLILPEIVRLEESLARLRAIRSAMRDVEACQ